MQKRASCAAGLLVLFSLVGVAACGSEVESPGAGSGGSGASQSTTSSSSAMDGTCDGDPCCLHQAPPESCCHSACCSSDCPTSGAGGAGSICGGKQGIPCAAGQWCDYGNNMCGNADDTGVCTPLPLDCPDGEPIATCACNGMIYQSECLANLAGFDVSNQGGCAAPTGTFPCGDVFCTINAQYCVRSVSDVGGYPDGYGCKALPPGCMDAAGPTCPCLANEPCGTMCDVTVPGGLQVTCPGG